jgi:hypothetical protein
MLQGPVPAYVARIAPHEARPRQHVCAATRCHRLHNLPCLRQLLPQHLGLTRLATPLRLGSVDLLHGQVSAAALYASGSRTSCSSSALQASFAKRISVAERTSAHSWRGLASLCSSPDRALYRRICSSSPTFIMSPHPRLGIFSSGGIAQPDCRTCPQVAESSYPPAPVHEASRLDRRWPMTDHFPRCVNMALGVLAVLALLAVVILLVSLTRRQ